jgi:hypothetical protein
MKDNRTLLEILKHPTDDDIIHYDIASGTAYFDNNIMSVSPWVGESYWAVYNDDSEEWDTFATVDELCQHIEGNKNVFNYIK